MTSPYLEPIDESDMDTKKPITGDAEFSEKKAELGAQKEQVEAEVKKEKEVSHEISRAEKDASYDKILSKVKTSPQEKIATEDIGLDAIKTSEKIDPESRINKLVDLAMNKGVVYAVKVAKKVDDNYVIDMLHDRLMADELHDALLKKGLIKEN